jgi:hypothetical protein
MRSLEQEHLVSLLDAYAEHAERVAGPEVGGLHAWRSRADRRERGDRHLGERLVAAVRLLAQEHVSARLLRPPTGKIRQGQGRSRPRG